MYLHFPLNDQGLLLLHYVQYIGATLKQKQVLRELEQLIKIFQEFCIKQCFKLESIPEITDRKNGVPEFLISKNGQKFSIECKTISPEKYHPIGKREAETFFNMLLKCEEYKQQVPEDSFASVEFTFDKSLKDSASEKMNENFYTPSQLLSFYKQVKDNPAHVTTTILNNRPLA